MNWQYQEINIEVLEEILRLLRITKEYALDKNRTTEPETLEENILTVPVLVEIVQAVILKSIVPDPGWFDGDQTKFEDW